MNISILKKLVKIADHLDKKSLYKEADVVDSIIKKAIAVKQPTFKEPKDLNAYQRKQLATLVDEADAHEQFSGHYVKGAKYDARRIAFLWGDEVVGFMTPMKEDKFGKGRWRAGAIFVDKNFRGMNIASRAIEDFFKDKKGYAWISNKNTSSQKAFSDAGFIKREERNVGDSDLDQGHNWYKD